MFERILVTTDGSTFANLALPVAAEFARHLRSQITLLHVLPDPARGRLTDEDLAPGTPYAGLRCELREAGQVLLDEAASELNVPGTHGRLIAARHRDVPDVILHQAGACGAGLIILSSHGHSGLRHLLLGSVAGRVVQGATVPVLLVRPPR